MVCASASVIDGASSCGFCWRVMPLRAMRTVL